jgi:hypothetical protein
MINAMPSAAEMVDIKVTSWGMQIAFFNLLARGGMKTSATRGMVFLF